MRVACLLVPDLPLAAELRAHPERVGRPLVIAAGPGPRAGVLAVSPEAARAGVHPFGSVAHAHATCAELCVRVASPALERSARRALLDVALSLAPRAELAVRSAGPFAAEAAVYLDASGTRALHRSEQGFAAAAGARARRLGLPAVVAVASSRAVSRLVARRLARDAPSAVRDLAPSAVRVLSPAAEAAFLARLPLDLLDPEPALAHRLTRFGVTMLGDVTRLPRRALAARLGPDALRLAALARGRSDEPPLSAPTGRRFEEALDLEAPIERMDALAFALRGLLSRLAERLGVRGLACGDLHLAFGLEGGGRDARRVGVAAPTRDPRVLVRLACIGIEAQPPERAIETISVETEGRAIRSDQLDLFRPAGPAPAALSRTISELEALCGPGRVGAPAVADDHHPSAFAVTPFGPGGRSRDAGHAIEATRPGVRPPDPARGHALHLSLRALRPPVPAAVRLRAGRPDALESAVARGRVVQLAGPWRVTGKWWSPDEHFAFDCFDVQTSDGTLFRLRLDRIARTWHVDAVYD